MSNTQVPEVLPSDGRPIDSSLKTYLLARGIQPATWRLLCRTGLQWIPEFTVYYHHRSKRRIHPTVLVDLVTIAQAFGSQRLVPTWLLHAFLQIGGNPNAPSATYTHRLNDLFPVCRRLGVLLEHANTESVVVLQDRAAEIFLWASRHACHIAPGTLRKASLQWFIRRVDALAEQERLQLQGSASWNTPYQLDRIFTLTVGRAEAIHAVILNTPLAVWEEGQTMRHCAKNYIDRSAKGRILMVSLRSSDKQTPWATVAYDLTESQLQIKALSGFANRLVDRSIVDVAKVFMGDLQLQHSQLGPATSVTLIPTNQELA